MTRIPPSVRAEVHARSNGVCECGCGQQASHLHHRKLRSQGGKHDPANLLDVHHECHERIHKNRDGYSYARGLLVHSWANPGDVPVTVGAT